MTINIIACGKSAENWDGSGISIGCNDAFKFGHSLNYLLLLNSPSQFEHSRLEIIKNTQVQKVYTCYPNQWRTLLGSNIHEFISRQWSHSNRLQKVSTNYLYHSKTSPFAAISLAFSWGFKKIILWGVDMIDHPTYRPGNGAFQSEYASYKTFIQSLNAAGCEVILGSEGSNLNFLPIWDRQQ